MDVLILLLHSSEDQQRLVTLEETAKSKNIGLHDPTTHAEHIRDVKWTVENPRHLVDSFHNKPIDGMLMYNVYGPRV